MPLEHVWMKCATSRGKDCDCSGNICRGGLGICKVCIGAEGALPTHCPGVPMTEEQMDDVYECRRDYVCTEHTPNGFWTLKNARPCWLCGTLSTKEEAGGVTMGTCRCCGILMHHSVPLIRPLAGPEWLWTRPMNITPAQAIHAAEMWQQACMDKEKACPTSMPTSD
jgi:hypothetical protein